MPDFTHLHVHTQYSILDGQADILTLQNKAIELGMNSIAITDHGNMFGVLEFMKKAKDTKIKPIIGCEMYVADGSRYEKKGKIDRSGYHLILLSKDLIGYKNLCKLCSFAFQKDAFYYTPRIDMELLSQYHEGLIASSACLGGEIASNILQQKSEEKAEEALMRYLDIFGEDFYLELMDHGISEQKLVNDALLRIASKYGVKLIATNDVHFVNAEDVKAHDILVCMNTGKDFDDKDRMTYTGNEYLKSPEEMAGLFEFCPEALANTQEIVDKTENYSLAQSVILPTFPIPEGFTNDNDYLEHLTWEGAKKAYPDMSEDIRKRLEYELSVVKERGYSGYFLIVADFIKEARKMGVSVGPGRGSAAGSAIAFCIGITGIDPIKYNLLFERFLNPERPSMPDIDVDFDDDGRERVKNFVVDKYGKEKVAHVITFGTMGAKSAIRDVARVLKLPLAEADRLAKLVPNTAKMTLEKAFDEVPELRKAKEMGSPLVKETLKYAQQLEGSIRHTGVHACGIIIGKDDLMEYLPLSTAKDADLMVTQYEGEQVESVGMLKMDFLGLKTLSIIQDALDNIEKRNGIRIDIDNIPLDDAKTFKLFQKGDTVGTFQFESDGMRNHLRELKPTNIEDLIAMNALYRPGPMAYIPLYISRKLGKKDVDYPHLWLVDILKPTHGIFVYQEQIMQAAQIMAGYTPGAADMLRWAMGKKKVDIMATEKIKFIDGAVKKGIEKEKAEEVFNVMEKFAEYGFNRSHAAAYSVVAYQTAYLKSHYPAEYMAAVLTRNLNDLKSITFFMDECKRAGIPVLIPDVNESDMKFTVNAKGEIRFGLGAIKGIGEGAVEAITSERTANGPFTSIFDLVTRVNLRACNKRCLEAMAMAGAFDGFEGSHRAQYIYQESNEDTTFIDKVIRHANSVVNMKVQSQHSLFGDSEDIVISDPELPNCEEWGKMDKLNREKEVTGIYISGHPLDDYRLEIQNFCNINLGETDDLKKLKNRELVFAGIVTSATHKTTKNGNPFGNFNIEDYEGSVSLALFGDEYVKFKSYLNKDYMLFIKARVQLKWKSDDQYDLKIYSISLISEVLKNHVREITLKIALGDVCEELIQKINSLMKKKKGNAAVKFAIYDTLDNLSVEMPAKFKVDSTEFLRNIAAIPEIKFRIN